MHSRLAAWHEFLYREPDSGKEKLITIFHPRESGQDNSPLWDEVIERINPGAE